MVALRVANVLVALGFGAAAAWRWNHPDTFVWALVYGYAAMVAVFASLGVRTLFAAALGLAGYALVAWRTLPEVSWGLWVAAAWMLGVLFQQLLARRSLRVT